MRPGGCWVRFWTASHSLKLKAGGKERAQGRPGRASAERAWRKTYCVEVDFDYLVRIQRFRLSSERPLHRDVQVPRSTGMCESGHCTGMCRCREAQARIVPYNPFAFPPLHRDVQVPRSTWMCESGHPWRSDVRERPWPRTFQSASQISMTDQTNKTLLLAQALIRRASVSPEIGRASCRERV